MWMYVKLAIFSVFGNFKEIPKTYLGILRPPITRHLNFDDESLTERKTSQPFKTSYQNFSTELFRNPFKVCMT